jgi:hypothetical protein
MAMLSDSRVPKKMALRIFEMPKIIYQSTRRNNAQDLKILSKNGKNLKPRESPLV